MPRVAQGLKTLGSNSAFKKEEPGDEGVSPNSSGVAKVQRNGAASDKTWLTLEAESSGQVTVLETEDSGAAPVFMVAYNQLQSGCRGTMAWQYLLLAQPLPLCAAICPAKGNALFL